MTCKLSNAGLVDITKISYRRFGMTVTGPKGLCEAGNDCGTVTITTGTAQRNLHSGTLTATSTPNTGSNASIAVNLVVSAPLTPASLSFANCIYK